MARGWFRSIFNRPEKAYAHPYLAGAILGVVLFLASPAAAYVSGAVLTVDGAMTPIVV